jgi:DNA gyrase subunit A
MELSHHHLRDALDIVNGLLVAVERWDEVSSVIYASEDRAEARERLAAPPLGFSPMQAEHVLDMTAGRRTAAGPRALLEERQRLQEATGGKGT